MEGGRKGGGKKEKERWRRDKKGRAETEEERGRWDMTSPVVQKMIRIVGRTSVTIIFPHFLKSLFVTFLPQ